MKGSRCSFQDVLHIANELSPVERINQNSVLDMTFFSRLLLGFGNTASELNCNCTTKLAVVFPHKYLFGSQDAVVVCAGIKL